MADMDGDMNGAGVASPPHAAARLLVVEDDGQLAGLLDRLLTGEGYRVETAADGQRGLHLLLTRVYDVVIMDRGLPVVDGLDLLRQMRRRGMTTPVLVLSARGNPVDRVEGLDAGAEDYLAKPFDVDELCARLRALRRRHLDTARWLPLPGWRLDLDARQAQSTSDGPMLSVALSERECDLLSTLAGRPNQVFGRKELLDLVFPDAANEIVVDTYVHYVRRKLGREVVTTVRGRGYRLGRP